MKTIPTNRLTSCCSPILYATLGMLVFSSVHCRTLYAQESGQDPVKLLQSPAPRNRLISQFDLWNQFSFRVKNASETDRAVLVTTSFDENPGQQFGGRVWVPAGSSRRGWMNVKIPPRTGDLDKAEVKETKTLVLETDGVSEYATATDMGRRVIEEHVRSAYWSSNTLVIANKGADSVHHYVDSLQRDLKGSHHFIDPTEYPKTTDALDGIDFIVLATNEIFDHPEAVDALRAWLFRGGNLWIELDHVSEPNVNQFLAEGSGITYVDEIDFNVFKFESGEDNSVYIEDESIEFEEPVHMVRVIGEGFTTSLKVDGWPASLHKEMGSGKLTLTTIGVKAFYVPKDFEQLIAHKPSNPTRTGESLGQYFLGSQNEAKAPPPDWAKLTDKYVGYEVASKSTITSILGGFCAILAIGAVLLVRQKKYFLILICAPILSVLATSGLAFIGGQSRAKSSATEAMIQFVEFDRQGGVYIQGGRAVSRTDSSQNQISIAEQGWVRPTEEIQGSPTRLIVNDEADRSYENLNLLAGIQQFQFDVYREGRPAVAFIRVEEDGLVGDIQGISPSGTSGLLVFPGGGHSAVQIGADGKLESRFTDVLAQGQFLSEDYLDDRRQVQRDIYEQLLVEERNFPKETRLYFWGTPEEFAIQDLKRDRFLGDALFSLPVEFERYASEEPIFIPSTMIFFRSITHPTWGGSTVFDNKKRIWHTSTSQNSHTTLQCRLPDQFVPFEVNEVKVSVDLRIPGREVKVIAESPDGGGHELAVLDSPVGHFEFRIEDADVFGSDADNFLRLLIHVGGIEGVDDVNPNTASWQIESVQLEGWIKTP